MKAFSSSLIIFAAAVFSASSTRLPARNDRRAEHSRDSGGSVMRPPRLFDEFLLEVISSGSIPDMYETNHHYATPNNTEPLANRTLASSNSVAGETSPIRNYIRHHRGNSIRERLLEERRNGNLPENTDRPIGRGRSNVVESSRHHSRQNIVSDSDIESIEDLLRGVPREHWSCCRLGELAGDKGFLCNAQFYASRVLSRNANRVHNRRLAGRYFRNGAATPTGSNLLSTFNDCVQTYETANEFAGCCNQTFQHWEARETRWNSFRHIVGTTN